MTFAGNPHHAPQGDALHHDEARATIGGDYRVVATVALHRCTCGGMHWFVDGPVREDDDDHEQPCEQSSMLDAIAALEQAAWAQDCPAAGGGRYRAST